MRCEWSCTGETIRCESRCTFSSSTMEENGHGTALVLVPQDHFGASPLNPTSRRYSLRIVSG
jgi:hypothetical protein